MEPATWGNCRADFERPYVDLVVPGTSRSVWEAFWTALRSGPFKVRLSFERRLSQHFKSLPLPRTVAWIFDLQEAEESMISAEVPSGPVTAGCYFNFMGGG